MTIINSAGTEVFATSNHKGQEWKDWDGKNSKGYDLPEGTYYYLLKLISVETGQVFRKSGFIVLKRY
jgi:flagellar hook assembly protein FlgD